MSVRLVSTQSGRTVELESIRVEDGGTLLTFDGYYLDTDRPISDKDYEYIQREWECELHRWA